MGNFEVGQKVTIYRFDGPLGSVVITRLLPTQIITADGARWSRSRRKELGKKGYRSIRPYADGDEERITEAAAKRAARDTLKADAEAAQVNMNPHRTVVYTYYEAVPIPLEKQQLQRAIEAIHAAHGYTPHPHEEPPQAVRAAVDLARSSFGNLVTIDVYADGRRRIR